MAIAAGCHPDSIDEFEARNGVLLPVGMRHYLLKVDGMKTTAEDSQDPRGFCFWSLSRIVPADEAIESHTPFLSHFPGDIGFFVFSDYLNWSWAYAVRLTSGSPNRVVIIGKHSPEIVAESFEEFVDLYLSDGHKLYEGIPVDVP
jgi:hypothetical protein